MKRTAGGYSARSLGAATRRGLVALAVFTVPAAAQFDPPAWTRPIAAFQITPDIWYVGTEGLAAYLIKTRAGAILIDGTMEENVAAVKANIAAAGVRLTDVKWLLVSHAHFDHAAGDAALKTATGAKLAAGAGDVAALESGIPPGETNYGVIKFPAVKVDRALRDVDVVRLGGATLTAIVTPGHTPGCMSYRMVSAGKRVLFPCSLTVAGNKLVGNRRYPGIVGDFQRSFARIAREHADIMLPFHPEGADLIGRHRRGQDFVQPGLVAEMVAKARVAFATDLAEQEAAARR